jgi:hypothetical protein
VVSEVSCCERLWIVHSQTGEVITPVDASEGGIFIPCDRLPSREGTLCILCRNEEGEEIRACVNYQCGTPSSGPIKPADCSADGVFDCLLSELFLGGDRNLPCGESLDSTGNQRLLDWNGDNAVTLTDAVGALSHLFRGGPAHVLGPTSDCVQLESCDAVCK